MIPYTNTQHYKSTIRSDASTRNQVNTRRRDSRQELHELNEQGIWIRVLQQSTEKERLSPDAGDGSGEAGARSEGDGRIESEDPGQEGESAGHWAGRSAEGRGNENKSGRRAVYYIK
jgi:hypothetical protein